MPSRTASNQHDLFRPAPPAPCPAAVVDPLPELRTLLARLRAADRLPWPDAAAAMAEEHRALGLARQAGPNGADLAAAILDETERLLAATDNPAS